MYTQDEVFRTAFKYVDSGASRFLSKEASESPHGINQVCICCKAGSQTPSDVSKIVDPVELRPWQQFYKTYEYAAYKCNVCGYMWSWYKVPK